MGLRCLLGHDFGEPELQREREEEGDEVVTTVKEVKTCARCGETQIVSENTEVTTMEQLADEAAAKAGGGNDAAAGAGDAPSAAEETADSGAAPEQVEADDAATAGEGLTLDEEPGAGSDDAVIIDDGPSGDEETEPAGAGASSEGVDAAADVAGGSNGASGSDPADTADGPDPTDEDAELLDAGGESPSSPAADAEPESASADETDAESDDGVILDDEAESTDDRERGAWPEVDEADADADGATAWPDHGGEDEGFSAEVGEGGDAGVEFGGGLTPEAAEGRTEAGEETEYVEAPDDAESVAFEAGGEDGTGITRGESPELETIGDDEPTEYYCPECGMVRAADGSSMRAGDICPECKRGYVDERPQ